MIGGEIGDNDAEKIVDGEKLDAMPFIDGAGEVRAASPSSARPDVSVEPIPMEIEVPADAGKMDGFEVRSDVEDVVGGDFEGLDLIIDEEELPGAENSKRAVAHGEAKADLATFAIEEPVAASVVSDGRGEEILKTEEEEIVKMLSSEDSGASESRETWMNGFQVGDMVWGKVKSHPWWPGHIFDDAFATSSVRKTKKEGHVLVAFFGDSSYGWFDPAELIPFEPHYAEKSKQTTSKNFTKAVDEAVDEASRRSALGLSCHCHNPLNIRPISIPGYFSVDVAGFEPGGIYSSKRIKEASDSFHPSKALSFLKQVAETPLDPELWSIEGIKQASILRATRRAIFEKFDRTYAEAFGGHGSRNSQDLQVGVEQPERVQSRAAPFSGPMVIAEPLGERHVSPAPVKKSNSKYLVKKREDSLAGDLVNPKKAADDQTPPPVADDKAVAATAALAAAHQRMMMSTPENGGAVKKKKRKREPGLIQPPPPPKKIATAPPSAAQPPPKFDLQAALDVDLPVALSELASLAVDPFRSAAISVRRVLLSFRALVFEKGLTFPPPKEYEPFLIRKGAAAAAVGEDQRVPPPPKPRKAAPPSSRADDPTKSGRKRLTPLDRVDEKSTKKPKKSTPVVPDKKVIPPPKPEPPLKKQEAAPTFLIMRFPQRTTLPSISSLKARFARFGPLDLSGTRVFWKSYTCKVLFKHKADAQAALSHAQSNEIFGQVKVNYSLRDPDLPETAAPPRTTQTQPKSILKKPAEDGGAAAAKETQRVKFLLGEPPVVVSKSAPQQNPGLKISTPSKTVCLPTSENLDVDFSRQMLSLLTRCSDIVTDVKSALGYAPYHPL